MNFDIRAHVQNLLKILLEDMNEEGYMMVPIELHSSKISIIKNLFHQKWQRRKKHKFESSVGFCKVSALLPLHLIHMSRLIFTTIKVSLLFLQMNHYPCIIVVFIWEMFSFEWYKKYRTSVDHIIAHHKSYHALDKHELWKNEKGIYLIVNFDSFILFFKSNIISVIPSIWCR